MTEKREPVNLCLSLHVTPEEIEAMSFLDRARLELLDLLRQADALRRAGIFGGIHFRLEVVTPEIRPAVSVELTTAALPDVDQVAELLHGNWLQKKLEAGVTTRPCAEDGSELIAPWSLLTEAAKELNRAPVRDVYAAIAASRRSTAEAICP